MLSPYIVRDIIEPSSWMRSMGSTDWKYINAFRLFFFFLMKKMQNEICVCVHKSCEFTVNSLKGKCHTCQTAENM